MQNDQERMDKAWENMRTILDIEMPEKKRRKKPIILFWWGIGLALFLVSTLLWSVSGMRDKDDSERIQITEKVDIHRGTSTNNQSVQQALHPEQQNELVQGDESKVVSSPTAEYAQLSDVVSKRVLGRSTNILVSDNQVEDIKKMMPYADNLERKSEKNTQHTIARNAERDDRQSNFSSLTKRDALVPLPSELIQSLDIMPVTNRISSLDIDVDYAPMQSILDTKHAGYLFDFAVQTSASMQPKTKTYSGQSSLLMGMKLNALPLRFRTGIGYMELHLNTDASLNKYRVESNVVFSDQDYSLKDLHLKYIYIPMMVDVSWKKWHFSSGIQHQFILHNNNSLITKNDAKTVSNNKKLRINETSYRIESKWSIQYDITSRWAVSAHAIMNHSKLYRLIPISEINVNRFGLGIQYQFGKIRM